MIGFLRRWADVCFRRNIKYSLPIIFLFGLVKESYRHNKLKPIEWLDENTTNLKKTFLSKTSGTSYGPLNCNGFQHIEHVQLPSVSLYYFENSIVSILSSSILSNNKIIIERLDSVDLMRCNYSAGHVFMHDKKNALVRHKQVSHLKKGFFLGGNGSSNYYHWMIEILPKLQFLHQVNQCGYADFPLLVSKDIQHIKPFCEALNIIAKDRPVVMLDKDKTYCVEKLIYINAPNNLPFNLRQNEKMRIADFLTRPESINFLKNQLCTILDSPPITNLYHRIFFARNNERRDYNQQEIFEIFKKQGFQKVFMEELSLKDQILLISNAEIIAGPTGAAWTNIIFCREGTKCLCWMAEGHGEFSAFSNLAKVVGAEMYYTTFKTDAKSPMELYYQNYTVDAKKIKQSLDTLLALSAKNH